MPRRAIKAVELAKSPLGGALIPNDDSLLYVRRDPAGCERLPPLRRGPAFRWRRSNQCIPLRHWLDYDSVAAREYIQPVVGNAVRYAFLRNKPGDLPTYGHNALVSPQAPSTVAGKFMIVDCGTPARSLGV